MIPIQANYNIKPTPIPHINTRSHLVYICITIIIITIPFCYSFANKILPQLLL